MIMVYTLKILVVPRIFCYNTHSCIEKEYPFFQMTIEGVKENENPEPVGL